MKRRKIFCIFQPAGLWEKSFLNPCHLCACDVPVQLEVPRRQKAGCINHEEQRPEAAVCHSTWKALKYVSARSAWAENCVLLTMMHLKGIKLNVRSQKTCWTSTPNFFPFLPYQRVAISISVLSMPLLFFMRPTELPPAFLMQVHLNEITEVNKASKIFSLPHGEFICPGFIFCNVWLLFLASCTQLGTQARWWCGFLPMCTWQMVLCVSSALRNAACSSPLWSKNSLGHVPKHLLFVWSSSDISVPAIHHNFKSWGDNSKYENHCRVNEANDRFWQIHMSVALRNLAWMSLNN